MASPETGMKEEKAVLWAFASHDRHGKVQVSAPVEIDARWEIGSSATINAQGTPIALDAAVYVNQSVTAESVMWRGELADLPTPVTGLYQVVSYSETPNIKGVEVQRDVGLKSYGDNLPEVV